MREGLAIEHHDGGSDFTRYGPALRRYFLRRAPHGLADDLVQEVFMAIQARRSDEAVDNMERYIFVVAHHVLERHGRRRKALRRLDGEAGAMAAFSDEISPERALLDRERLRAAIEVIQGLPPKTQLVFSLHRFENMTYPAIARELGVTVSAVEKHISSALRVLLRDASEAAL